MVQVGWVNNHIVWKSVVRGFRMGCYAYGCLRCCVFCSCMDGDCNKNESCMRGVALFT